MSKTSWALSDDKSPAGDLPKDAPEGQVDDSSYVTKKNESVPVVDDSAPVEDPIESNEADSDKQLERDDTEAIDKSNILKEKTRGARPQGTYREPTDEEFGLTEK